MPQNKRLRLLLLLPLVVVTACTNEVLAPTPDEPVFEETTPIAPAPPADDDGDVDEEPAPPPGDPNVNDEDPNFGDPIEEPVEEEPDEEEPDEEAPVSCSYPSTSGGFDQTGDVIPALAWSSARLPSGAATSWSLADFHCDTSKNGVVLLLAAGWCGNCPSYLNELAPDVAALEAAGLQVALVLFEDESGNRASDVDAAAYADRYFDGSVLRLGANDTLYNSSIWTSFPGALVVRRSDMRVIANQEDQGQTLDFRAIADELAAEAP